MSLISQQNCAFSIDTCIYSSFIHIYRFINNFRLYSKSIYLLYSQRKPYFECWPTLNGLWQLQKIITGAKNDEIQPHVYVFCGRFAYCSVNNMHKWKSLKTGISKSNIKETKACFHWKIHNKVLQHWYFQLLHAAFQSQQSLKQLFKRQWIYYPNALKLTTTFFNTVEELWFLLLP